MISEIIHLIFRTLIMMRQKCGRKPVIVSAGGLGRSAATCLPSAIVLHKRWKSRCVSWASTTQPGSCNATGYHRYHAQFIVSACCTTPKEVNGARYVNGYEGLLLGFLRSGNERQPTPDFRPHPVSSQFAWSQLLSPPVSVSGLSG